MEENHRDQWRTDGQQDWIWHPMDRKPRPNRVSLNHGGSGWWMGCNCWECWWSGKWGWWPRRRKELMRLGWERAMREARPVEPDQRPIV